MKRRSYRATLAMAGFVLLLTALLALAAWLYARTWAPSRADYPMQGLSVSADTGPIEWGTIRAAHPDFAYIRASAGTRRDPAFAANLTGARALGIRVGVVHDFDLCHSPADQATMFMTTVPHDNALLPPAVRLALTPGCDQRPGRDAMLAALNTFLNLIEAHSGKPAVLRVSPAFEALYSVGGGINRTLWLERNFMKPAYADRPWVIWTATDMRRLDGVDGPVEWDVVTP